MTNYITENVRTPFLTSSQIDALVVRASAPGNTTEELWDAEAAADELVSAFMPAIRHAARDAKILDPDDALSIALEAFWRWVRRYDPTSNGHDFAPVVPTILFNAISEADRVNSSVVTVRATAAAKYWRIYHAYDGDLEAAYAACRDGLTDLPAYSFLAVHHAFNEVETASWEGTKKGGADPSVSGALRDSHDLLGHMTTPGPEERAVEESLVAWLFEQVTDRQALVLRLRYGFMDHATDAVREAKGYPLGLDLSDVQVAHATGIPRSTVQREKTAALATMRAAMQELANDEDGV